jgi:hypothetical protein
MRGGLNLTSARVMMTVNPMRKKNSLTKGLAIGGTILVWFPILAPFIFAARPLIRGGVLHFDYLMPAELFPFALVGGGLLLWAGLRARWRWGLFAWGLGIAAGLLVGSQALAVVTGIASGEAEPSGWLWAMIIGALGVYVLALLAIGIGGVLLVRDLFKPDTSEIESVA